MKRLQAKCRLKHPCIYCNTAITKNNIYYKRRIVFTEYNDTKGKQDIIAFEHNICSKCNYGQQRKNLRYLGFISSDRCKHPKHLIQEVYATLQGEPHLRVPSHQVCTVCDKAL